MARLNVYLPDDLAERARAAGLNVSALTQSAVATELQRRSTDTWLASVLTLAQPGSHEMAIAALDAARAELGDYR